MKNPQGFPAASRGYPACALAKKTDLGKPEIGAQFLSFYFPNRRFADSSQAIARGVVFSFDCGSRRKQMAGDARRQRESLDQFSANTNR
jgi:hypothetical protein